MDGLRFFVGLLLLLGFWLVGWFFGFYCILVHCEGFSRKNILKIQNKKRKLAAGAFATKKPSANEIKQNKFNEIKALIDLQLDPVVFCINNIFNILDNTSLQVT